MHQLCNAFVEHSVHQVRCLVPLLVFVLLYGPKHEVFFRERERAREGEREREREGERERGRERESDNKVQLPLLRSCR